MEKLCLADFASLYNFVRDAKEESITDDSGFLPECSVEENNEDDLHLDMEEDQTHHNFLSLKGGVRLVRRTKPKIIRSVRFNKSKDPENHFREQLMLYTPWRNETKDVIDHDESYQEKFQRLYDVISHNRLKYENHADIIEKAYEDLNDLDSDQFVNVAPCAQHSDEQDVSTGTKESELFGCFDPGKTKMH